MRTWARRVGSALLLAAALVFFGDAASFALVDCVANPTDPACVSPSPTPTPTPTPDPAPTTSPTPSPAPGVDTGVYVDPSTGSLRVDENTGVAVGVVAWLGAVVAGLMTAWLVLP